MLKAQDLIDGAQSTFFLSLAVLRVDQEGRICLDEEACRIKGCRLD